MPRALRLPAKVGLRGLTIERNDGVPDEFRGRLVSWGCLDFLPALSAIRMAPFDTDGKRITSGGKNVELEIRSEVIGDIARRARARYFQRSPEHISYKRRFEARHHNPNATPKPIVQDSHSNKLILWCLWFAIGIGFCILLRWFSNVAVVDYIPFAPEPTQRILWGFVLLIYSLPLVMFWLAARQYRIRPFIRTIILSDDGVIVESNRGILHRNSWGEVNWHEYEQKHFNRIYTAAQSWRRFNRFEPLRPQHKARTFWWHAFWWVVIPMLMFMAQLIGPDSPENTHWGPRVGFAMFTFGCVICPLMVSLLIVFDKKHSRDMYLKHHARDRAGSDET